MLALLVTALGLLLLSTSLMPVGLTPQAAAQQEEQDSPWVRYDKQPPESLISPSPKPTVSSYAMAQFPPTQEVVLEGGGQTWAWNGTTWFQKNPARVPPAVSGAAMAYHQATGRLIRFGGNGSLGTQTWAYDAQTQSWEEATPEKPGSRCLAERDPVLCISPTERAFPAMAEYPVTGKVLLFGGTPRTAAGRIGDCAPTWCNDTWTWDGVTWKKESSADRPSQREGVSMAYDAARQKVVLFGGRNSEVPQHKNDTWTWDHEGGWTLQNLAVPPQRAFGAPMSYLAAIQRVVLFSPSSSTSPSGTWTWDGANWEKRSPPVSPSGVGGAMAAHDLSERVVLFGGETWTWDGKKGDGTTKGPLQTTLDLTVEPDSIPADGMAQSTGTVRFFMEGQQIRTTEPTRAVQVVTDGDAQLSQPEEQLDGSWIVRITAGEKPGRQLLTASARVTGGYQANGSAVLTQSPSPCADGLRQGPAWAHLDPTFGCGGKVKAHIPNGLVPGQPEHKYQFARGMALYPGGKIVTIGSPDVARFEPDGSVDGQFGTGGGVHNPDWWTYGVAVQDKKILLAAQVRTTSGDTVPCPSGGGRCAPALIRLTERGGVDSDFGDGGQVRLPLHYVSSRILHQDGKILILGVTSNGQNRVAPPTGNSIADSFTAGSTSYKQWLVRYHANGVLDTEFGTGGRLASDYTSSFAVQRDRKIVTAGNGPQPGEIRITRYLDNGDLDRTFNNKCLPAEPPCGGSVEDPAFAAEDPGGTQETNGVQPMYFYVTKVLIQTGNKIVVVGGTRYGQWGSAMARYTSEGVRDITFNPCPSDGAGPYCGGTRMDNFDGHESRGPGLEGATGSPPNAFEPQSAVLQDDEKIIVAGYGPSLRSDFLVARYSANGALQECGVKQFVRTRFGWTAQASSMALQRDGRIVVAGYHDRKSGNPQNYIALARYMGGGPSSVVKASVSGSPPVAEPRIGEGPAKARFTVSLDHPVCSTATIDYRTMDGSAAAANGDYAPATDSVRFGPGEKVKEIEVEVNADSVQEPQETFTIELSNPRTADDSPVDSLPGGTPRLSLKDRTAEAVILDTSPPRPEASVGDVAVPESFTGQVPAVFTVTLSGRAPEEVKMAYATEDGTAKANADYVPASGTLTIPKGSASGKVTVPVLGDTLKEPTEDFKLSLSKPENSELAKVTGTGRILDAVPGLSIGDTSVVEGNADTTPAVFTVTNNAPPAQRVSVDYAAEPAGALPQEDFIPTGGSLAFAPEQNFNLVTVDVVADTKDEPDEDFLVRLANASGGAIAREQGHGMIKDDDEPGTEAAPDPRLGPRAAAGFAPGSLPPSATVNAGQVQAQTNVQAQSQFNAQSQAQAQLTAQLSQSPATAAQTQSQGALAAERERQKEFQVEVESGEQTSSAKAMGHLAASRQQTVPMGATAVAWAGSIFALAAGLFYRNKITGKNDSGQLVSERNRLDGEQPDRRTFGRGH